MAEHNESGTHGEELAVAFLKKNGYTVLETNWRHQHLEADIIAVFKDLVVIVEVKTRSGNFFGEPETFVTRQKKKNLQTAANAYIQSKHLDMEVRFDIISITLGKSLEQARINHIEDAFLFS